MLTPLFLTRDNLQLSDLMSLAVSPDGRRVYVGRALSDDQSRENLAVLDIDPQTGTLLGKRLYRDSDRPLPPSYTTPKPPLRPRSTVSAIVVGARYNKLYLAVQLEDTAIRPAHFLSVYDLNEQGDPIAASLRTYRADIDGFTGPIVIEGMALNSAMHALYMVGFGWPAVRYYLLDESGEPLGTQPKVVKVGGPSGKRALAVNATGTRLYLGAHPLTLELVRLENGVPVLEPGAPGQPPKPLRTLISSQPLGFGGDNYLRFVQTPRQLFAARPLNTLVGGQPPHAIPLYALPLDAAGDILPDVNDFRRIDGFDHVLLSHHSANDRLWLARESAAAPPAPTPVVDGVELVEYLSDTTAGKEGLPGMEQARSPKRYAQQTTLAAVMPGSGRPVVLTRRTQVVVDYATGERIQFRIQRVTPNPAQPPVQFSCRLLRIATTLLEDFKVLEGELSPPIVLDKFLTGQPGQAALRLSFPPAAAGVEWRVEVHYTPAGAPAALVKADTVRSGSVLFLLPGYSCAPPEQRSEQFELFSAHWERYRAAAEAVALVPEERPDQFVVSAYSLSGAQGHTAQLEHGLAVLRALGINSVQLGSWDGIPASELAQHAKDFSPEAGVYAPPLGCPFEFMYDGSLVEQGTGRVVDATYLREWAELQATQAAQHTGMSPGRFVRFQLADEPGWYFPDVLRCLARVDPTTLTNQKVDWRDPQRKNATWIARFQTYVEHNDPDLVATFGEGWREMGPIGASQATTPATRRLFYWSLRFFIDQASDGVQRLCDELQTAFEAPRAPSPRPEHNRLHVHINFGDVLDWQWHKPYPNAKGDKNPDQGPDVATGGFDWFSLGRKEGVLPSKHTYMSDAEAQVWSFYADLLRSVTTPPGTGREPAFGAFVPGSRLGGLEAGAAYKVLSLIARGTKFVTAYAFGPVFLSPPPNSWSDNFAAYASLADALRLLGRAQQVLYPGKPEGGKVAIHLPAGSRLWDNSMFATFGYREALPLHTALVHDGYAVDFVDDIAIRSGALPSRGYTTLYLLGPNLDANAQRLVADWVRGGGTVVALPGAATADEANEPTTLLDGVLGVSRQAPWSPLREPAHPARTGSLSYRLEVADPAWQEVLGPASTLLLRDLVVNPLQARWVDFPSYETAGAQVVATLQPAGGSGTARPAITRHRVGAGAAYSYAFFPGWQYWCTATHSTLTSFQDRLPRNWSTPDRLLATLPVRLAHTPRSVVMSHPAVEARRIESDAGIAVMLFNWTGAPLAKCTTTVHGATRFPRISSVRQGPLRQDAVVDKTSRRVTLPLDNVDVLLLEP